MRGNNSMVLCNQGCKSHIYFRDGEPYNLSDDEPHKKTCQSLKIGKWWGGYFNTIPMNMILSSIQMAYDEAVKADDSKNVYDLVSSAKATRQYLASVIRNMQTQQTKNDKWKEEFAEYKTNLVQEQTLREERKRTHDQQKKQQQASQFTTADKL